MPVIAVEGLSGVGKTTTAELLARRAGGLAVASLPLSAASRWRQRVVNGDTDVEARFDYFLGLNKWQMQQARRYAEAEDGAVAVLDASIYRTVVTHRVLGSQAAWEYELETSDVLPDRTVYLKLRDEQRAARLKKRDGGLVFTSHWDEELYRRRHEVDAGYRSMELPTIWIDGMPPHTVAADVERMAQLNVDTL